MAQAVHTFAVLAEQTIAAAAISFGASGAFFNAAFLYGRIRVGHGPAFGVVITTVIVIFAGIIIINATFLDRKSRISRLFAHQSFTTRVLGDYLLVTHLVQARPRVLEITVFIIVAELKGDKQSRRRSVEESGNECEWGNRTREERYCEKLTNNILR